MAKASSANFGSCPLAVSVAVVTSDGGRTSSKASALRSRASWHRARPSVAPRPRVMANIDPLILIARSLSRIPSSVPISQCGTALVLGERLGHVRRAADHPVVAVRRPVRGVRVDQVRQHQEDVAQGLGDLVVLDGELLLLLAELPALGLTLLGDGHVAGPPQLPDLPRQLVDVGPQFVAPGRDLAQPLVEHGGGVDLVEQAPDRPVGPSRRALRRGRCAAAGRRSRERDATGSRSADAPPFLAQDCVGRVGSSAGGTRANSRATSSNVNGSSS